MRQATNSKVLKGLLLAGFISAGRLDPLVSGQVLCPSFHARLTVQLNKGERALLIGVTSSALRR